MLRRRHHYDNDGCIYKFYVCSILFGLAIAGGFISIILDIMFGSPATDVADWTLPSCGILILFVVAAFIALARYNRIRDEREQRFTHEKLLACSLDDLDRMSGIQFEQWIAAYLADQGFEAHITPDSGDYGLDVIATRDGIKFGIQAKRMSGNVGNAAVQQAIAGCTYYNCSIAVVFTQSYFTPAAHRQATESTHPVILIDREMITQAADMLMAHITS